MSDFVPTLDGEIDPYNPANFDKPLWCVYGPECFPTLFCCKILYLPSYGPIGPCVWGYSVYRRQPGFRTLGQSLKNWLANEHTGKAHFFEYQECAMEYLRQLTTPRI